MFAPQATAPSVPEPLYVTSVEELMWFAALMAVTMAFHGIGMIMTLRVTAGFVKNFKKLHPIILGLSSIILASWMIVLVHLLEVMVWAAFFLWTGSLPNVSTSYYFALLEYTTLGSDLHLPVRWRMLEGGIAIAGLLTFAWSTGVLMLLAWQLQDTQLQKYEKHWQSGRARRAGNRGDDAEPGA